MVVGRNRQTRFPRYVRTVRALRQRCLLDSQRGYLVEDGAGFRIGFDLSTRHVVRIFLVAVELGATANARYATFTRLAHGS